MMASSTSGRQMLVRGAVVVLCGLVLSACVRETPEDRRFIKDGAGRSLILHGANVASAAKSTADHLPLHTEADVARMGDEWGMNLSRFLLQWQQLEPAPGVYDEAYLDAVAERVGWFADHGVHVVLDMHQDIYGPAVGGNGAPAWATRTDGLKLLPITGPWTLQYLQPAVNRAFDHFWGDADLRGHYVAAWRHVAQRFASDERVLGYDIMNEPWPGTRSAGFERGLLAAMYQDVIDGIRIDDPDKWVFVEPQSFLVNQGLPSNLPRLDDPREGEDRLAYFPHLYTVDQELSGRYGGNPIWIDLWATSRTREQARLGMPTLLGEFGMPATMPGWDGYLEEILQMADETTSGWAYWSYEISGPEDTGSWGLSDHDGNETPHVAHLVRTYARAVAGHPTATRFDPATAEFTLTFAETGVDAATEIFVPEARRYPGGWVVECSDPDGAWSSSWDPDRQILSVRTDPTVDTHTIKVRPAGS